MSWSTNFEAASVEEIDEKAKAFALTLNSTDAIVAARQQEQVSTAAEVASELAATMGDPPYFVQINGHAQPKAGPGDSIGVYVNRK